LLINIFPGGPNIVTVPGGASFVPSNPGAGLVRFNTISGTLEINDGGNQWYPLSETYTVSLSNDANDAIAWARNKMHEDRELEAMARKHPTMQSLVEDRQQLDEKIKVAMGIVKES
jgi:hypothetical protein